MTVVCEHMKAANEKVFRYYIIYYTREKLQKRHGQNTESFIWIW